MMMNKQPNNMNQTQPDPMDRAPEQFKPIKITDDEAVEFMDIQREKECLPILVEEFIQTARKQIQDVMKKQQSHWNTLLEKYNVNKTDGNTYAFNPIDKTIIAIENEQDHNPFSN